MMNSEFIKSLGLGGTPKRQGQTWSYKDWQELQYLLSRGEPFNQIAFRLQRSEYAIHCAVEKMKAGEAPIALAPPNGMELSMNFDWQLEACRRTKELFNATQTHKQQGDEDVKTHHIASLVQENYTTVGVVFSEGGTVYTYKTKDLNLAVDDKVLVFARGDFKVVTIVRIDLTPQIDTDSSYIYQWIVQKVDTLAYDTLVAQEKAFIATLKEIEKNKKRQQVLEDLTEHLATDEQSKLTLNSAIKQLNGVVETQE